MLCDDLNSLDGGGGEEGGGICIFVFQLSSAAHSCSTRCDPMDGRAPGLPVHH